MEVNDETGQKKASINLYPAENGTLYKSEADRVLNAHKGGHRRLI